MGLRCASNGKADADFWWPRKREVSLIEQMEPNPWGGGFRRSLKSVGLRVGNRFQFAKIVSSLMLLRCLGRVLAMIDP